MEHDDQDTSANAWLVPVLATSAFIGMLGLLALGPFLPSMTADLNTSVALLGQVPALAMLVAAALGLVIGPLADQYGHRRTLLIGLLTIVISAVGTGLATSYLLLLLAVLIGSIGRAILFPVSQAVAGLRFSGPAQRRAISWIVSGASGSAIVGVPLLTTIAGVSSWRVAFLTLAVVTLVVLLLTYRLMEPDAAPARIAINVRHILTTYGTLLHHRPTFGMLAASLIGNAGIWVLATYLGAFLVERHGASTQAVGWVYLAVGGAVLVGSLLAGGRLGRLAMRPLLISTRLITGLLLGASFLLPVSTWAVAALITVGSIATGISVVAITLILSNESPAGRATTLTFNGSLLSLGIALGSGLGGLLLAVSDYPALGLGIIALLASAAGLIWWSRPEPVVVAAPVTPPVAGD